MDPKKRGDDAADHAPRPDADGSPSSTPDKRDAANYDKTEDGGRAVPTEDINSANDE